MEPDVVFPTWTMRSRNVAQSYYVAARCGVARMLSKVASQATSSDREVCPNTYDILWLRALPYIHGDRRCSAVSPALHRAPVLMPDNQND